MTSGFSKLKGVRSTRVSRPLARSGMMSSSLSSRDRQQTNANLPDRFIKGECPKCGAKDQYGDNCEVCGAAYAPTELKEPYSAVSGAKPELRNSDHYFFRLSDPRCQKFLQEWTRSGTLQPEAANKMQEWLGSGDENKLTDWDISRDAPYFGIPIPDAPGKFFYVWLDAPIGYLASLKSYFESGKAREHGETRSFEQFLTAADTRQVHFIGKDIIYFHTLFWPAMLKGAGYRTPTAVFCHGFLTVNGLKMSKSRGTFIMARTFLDHLNPEYLRYYFAAKLGDGIDDIDLNLEDFTQRVNSALVGKLVNIASRCAGFVTKRFDGRLGTALDQEELYQEFVGAGRDIAVLYEKREFNTAMRAIMALADKANQYIDDKKPWTLIKEPATQREVLAICTTGINLFRVLMTYLKPVLPATAEKAEAFLRISPLTWNNYETPLLDYEIAPYEALLTRVEADKANAVIEDSRQTRAPAAHPAAAQAAPAAVGERDGVEADRGVLGAPAGAARHVRSG